MASPVFENKLGILAHVLDYLEPDRRYSEVCRAFRAANERLRTREGKKLDVSSVVHEAYPAVTAEEIDKMIAEKSASIPFAFRVFYDAQPKTQAFLSRTRALLDDVTEVTIKAFLVREKLSVRFQACMQQANPLWALHTAQYQEVQPFYLRTLFGQHAKRTADSFAALKFVRSEEIVLDVAYEKEKSLHIFWNTLNQQLHAPVLQTTAEILAYLQTPAHALALEQVTDLGLDNLTIVPDEVRRLTGLTRLEITFADSVQETVLPEAIGYLQNLEILVLKKAKFAEFPEIILQLPHLVHITMPQSQNTFTRISKEAWNHIGRGWASSLLGSMIALRANTLFTPGIDPASEELHTKNTLGRQLKDLREMPFELWVQGILEDLNKLITVVIALPLLPFVPFFFIFQFLQELDTGIAILDSIVFEMGAIGGVVMGTLLIPLFAVACAPFVLLNFIFLQGILPLISYVRRALGYSPMVTTA